MTCHKKKQHCSLWYFRNTFWIGVQTSILSLIETQKGRNCPPVLGASLDSSVVEVLEGRKCTEGCTFVSFQREVLTCSEMEGENQIEGKKVLSYETNTYLFCMMAQNMILWSEFHGVLVGVDYVDCEHALPVNRTKKRVCEELNFSRSREVTECQQLRKQLCWSFCCNTSVLSKIQAELDDINRAEKEGWNRWVKEGNCKRL